MSTTDTFATRPTKTANTSGMPLVLRFALREMRAGLRGFYVFVACVALGVAVITGVGALGDALKSGFESQGQSILGGDVTFARAHKRAEPAERAWIDARGQSSETATMRTMARTLDGEDQALAELKGVDAAYPLVGAVKLSGGQTLDAAIRGTTSAALDPVLMERLKLKIGDKFTLGTLPVTVSATIEVEPDTISDRLTFGPRIFVSHETLEKTGLVQPGSLVRWRYALKLVNAAATSEAEKLVPESSTKPRQRACLSCL